MPRSVFGRGTRREAPDGARIMLIAMVIVQHQPLDMMEWPAIDSKPLIDIQSHFKVSKQFAHK